jgi:hypothetical protein
MAFTEERLNSIYDKTDGYCHLCHKKISFKNYGKHGVKGAWHVDHSLAQAKGGSHHLNNLFPACVACNLSKGSSRTQSVRKSNGVSRAPHSKHKKASIQSDNTLAGILGGGLLGAAFGPGGMVVGALIGGAIGENSSPKR